MASSSLPLSRQRNVFGLGLLSLGLQSGFPNGSSTILSYSLPCAFLKKLYFCVSVVVCVCVCVHSILGYLFCFAFYLSWQISHMVIVDF